MTPVSLAADKTLTWYIKAVQQVGFPILVAAVLLWILINDMPENAKAASRDAALARQAIADHVAENRMAIERISIQHAEESIRLARIMQQICVNTATTPGERDRCFPE